MLRVDIHDPADILSLKSEGSSAVMTSSTRTLMTRCRDGMKLGVDLTEVTFIDVVGEEVLSFFSRLGAQFVAPFLHSRCL